jgi:hypothetical protein
MECGHLDQQHVRPLPGLYIVGTFDHLDGGNPTAAV